MAYEDNSQMVKLKQTVFNDTHKSFQEEPPEDTLVGLLNRQKLIQQLVNSNTTKTTTSGFSQADYDKLFNPNVNFSAYVSGLNKLNTGIEQNQALTGYRYSPAVRGSIMEGALSAGSEQAMADVNLAKQQGIQQQTFKLQEQSLDIQRQQLEAIKDQDGGGGGTVICTELHRQGMIDDDMYWFDEEYGKTVPKDSLLGYRMLFSPIAMKMRESRFVTYLMKPFGKAFAKESRHRMQPHRRGSLLGFILITVGIPLCGAFYRMTRRYSYGV